ncbi:hypothetical protein [Methylacidiphilum kamchatkense]|uniref:hypothetical protein n=1 Tax=Methylacidiphilum kamchatkense TaxID=431057 RepID=UPI0013792E7B|nr:hypothetical protein [Methylacidiphilum kamchatkense]
MIGFLLAAGGLRIFRKKRMCYLAADYLLCFLIVMTVLSGIPKMVFDPIEGIITQGLVSHIGQINIEGMKIEGKNPREWWDNWLSNSKSSFGSKFSLEYSVEKSQGIWKYFPHRYEELEAKAKETFQKFLPYDFPSEKIKKLLLFLLITTGKGFFHSVLFFSYILSQLSLFFYLLIPIVLNFIEECLMLLSLFLCLCFGLTLPLKPHIQLMGQSYRFFLLSFIPNCLWIILSFLCYLLFTSLYGAIFDEGGGFLAFFHSASHDIRHALSKTYCLFSFLEFLPETFKIVFSGFWELSWEAGFFCLVSFCLSLFLFLGITIPLWAMFRTISLTKNAPAVAFRLFRKIRYGLGKTIYNMISKIKNISLCFQEKEFFSSKSKTEPKKDPASYS